MIAKIDRINDYVWKAILKQKDHEQGLWNIANSEQSFGTIKQLHSRIVEDSKQVTRVCGSKLTGLNKNSNEFAMRSIREVFTKGFLNRNPAIRAMIM